MPYSSNNANNSNISNDFKDLELWLKNQEDDVLDDDSSASSTSSVMMSSSSSLTSSQFGAGQPSGGALSQGGRSSSTHSHVQEAANKLSMLRWNPQPQSEREREALSRRASHHAGNVGSMAENMLSGHGHRRLDRTQSEPNKTMNVNTSRYKTELCRPHEESGFCKYGDKCQFAHGIHDLRSLARHPKYKTELCRTFHTEGICPYGTRCHFIHEEELRGKPVIVNDNNNFRQIHRPTPLRLRGSSISSGTASPASSLGSGSPPPSATANNAFSFSVMMPSPVRCMSPLSFTQSPPPRPASPDRLPVFSDISQSSLNPDIRIIFCLPDFPPTFPNNNNNGNNPNNSNNFNNYNNRNNF